MKLLVSYVEYLFVGFCCTGSCLIVCRVVCLLVSVVSRCCSCVCFYVFAAPACFYFLLCFQVE
jgi:hypothetical protein